MELVILTQKCQLKEVEVAYLDAGMEKTMKSLLKLECSDPKNRVARGSTVMT